MKKLALAFAITLAASLTACSDPKPDAVPVEPQTQTEKTEIEVTEKKDGVKINVDAESNKVGIEADGVDINVDGKD